MTYEPGQRRPIKVAFCITELDVGGAERCLVELVCGLDRARFQSKVFILGKRPPAPHDSLYVRLEQAGVPFACFDGNSAISSPRVVLGLVRQLRAFQPDLLQTFLWHANLLGRVAARLAGVRHVVSGIRVAEHRGTWRLRWDRWTDRWVERHVSVSEAVADFSRVEGRLPAEKIVVIPNGVDLARFNGVAPADMTQFGVPIGARTLVYVGRLDPQKRVDWLLELLTHTFKAAHHCHLVIVGEGSERGRLERLAREYGLDTRVHFAGFRRDIPEILAGSQLLVLPSAWEGMPNVILEAMASSRPVVATDVEGVRELLGPEASRQVAPAGSWRLFSDHLLALLDDAHLCAKLGAANHERASQYSLASMIDRYGALYEELCQKR